MSKILICKWGLIDCIFKILMLQDFKMVFLPYLKSFGVFFFGGGGY